MDYTLYISPVVAREKLPLLSWVFLGRRGLHQTLQTYTSPGITLDKSTKNIFKDIFKDGKILENIFICLNKILAKFLTWI